MDSTCQILNSMEKSVEDEVKEAMQPILEKVFAHYLVDANDLNTKKTIVTRILQSVCKCLGSDWSEIMRSKDGLVVHPYNMKFIEEKWKNYIESSNFTMTKDDVNAYHMIKLSDVVNHHDMTKFISLMVKRDTADRKADDKILNSNDLNILLAVDGFSGTKITDVKNYAENVKYGPGDNNHVDTVRKMYEHDLLKNLHGEISANLVYMALLKAYSGFVRNEKVSHVIKLTLAEIKSYLVSNSTYYKDVNRALEGMSSLVKFYQSNMDGIDGVATVKCDVLYNRSKRNSVSDTKSRKGRPKKSIASETDEEIEKKRPRIVKTLHVDSSGDDQ